MNYINYIGMVRSNLCHVLTEHKGNEKRIKKIRESIESIEMVRAPIFSPVDRAIDRELTIEIDFYEALNVFYNNEVNRLVTIILNESARV